MSLGRMDWWAMRSPSSMPVSWMATSSLMSRTASLFLQALQEDAEEKQVDADDHLNSIDPT